MATIRCVDSKNEKVVYLKTKTLPMYATLAIVDITDNTVILEDPDKGWYDVSSEYMWLVQDCKKALEASA